jgi:hypothetical protein
VKTQEESEVAQVMQSSAGMELPYLRCSCVCRPVAGLRFSAAGPGNDLRGALGYALPEEWFRPRREEGPSGLRDVPRPFVLRVAGLPAEVPAGGEFTFGVHLFDRAARPLMEAAIARVARAGLGPERTPFHFRGEWREQRIDLSPGTEAAAGLSVEFVTPTELKGHDGQGAPPFEVLVARARDRLSALLFAYGGVSPEWDFAGLRERARLVRLAGEDLRRAGGVRVSTRTHQSHAVAGFAGRAEYEGAVGEFVPLLRGAGCAGVGRHTVWGNGEIRVTVSHAMERA